MNDLDLKTLYEILPTLVKNLDDPYAGVSFHPGDIETLLRLYLQIAADVQKQEVQPTQLDIYGNPYNKPSPRYPEASNPCGEEPRQEPWQDIARQLKGGVKILLHPHAIFCVTGYNDVYSLPEGIYTVKGSISEHPEPPKGYPREGWVALSDRLPTHNGKHLCWIHPCDVIGIVED